jgi:hypothetical protein
MPQRITKGKALVGEIRTNVLDIGGTELTATATELNAIADVSVNGAIHKVKKISISSTPTGSEQDTTFDLPAKAIVTDVWVDVTTAEATGGTKTLDVGLLSSESGGDADGFLDGISVATTGLKRGIPTFTVGSNETFYASTTRGSLLRTVSLAGADVAGDVGTYHERPHLSDSVTAKSVSYTAGSNDFAEFRGAIYIAYIEQG